MLSGVDVYVRMEGTQIVPLEVYNLQDLKVLLTRRPSSDKQEKDKVLDTCMHQLSLARSAKRLRKT